MREASGQPAWKNDLRRYSLTASSGTRNDLPTRTAGSSPPCTRRYTVIFDTRIAAATSALVLFFAWFMCLFWVISDIFRSKDLSGVAKTFWVFFVIILPWLGILVYLIARGHGMQQRQLEQAQEMNAAQTEYIRSVAGSSGGSSADQIASAKSLLDSGTITQAEFEALKAKALA